MTPIRHLFVCRNSTVECHSVLYVLDGELIPRKPYPFIIQPKYVAVNELYTVNSDLYRSLCCCFFPQHKPQFCTVKWGLNIADSKLKAQSTFSWQGHQERWARGEQIQVLAPVELIMTTRRPLGLDPLFLQHYPALERSFYGFQCLLTKHSCCIKAKHSLTCSFLTLFFLF